MASNTASLLMIAGSALFFVGVAIAVPRVFTEPEPEEKVRMLEEGLLWWRLGQPFCALGPVVAALGAGPLATAEEATSGAWFVASCALLVTGALAWSLSTYRRALRPREFALGQLPGWPWATYVWLTFAGLFALGAGFLAGSWAAWLGWLIVGADALFVAVYLRYHDLPPFVFYVLLSVVGFAVL